MTYVNGAVIAVPTANKQAYTDMASLMGRLMKKHGALQVFDGWGTNVEDGDVTSFPKAVQCKADETVVFSWIIWPSKAASDEGMEKAMSDPDLEAHVNGPPFDGKRMIFGGFEPLVQL